MLIEPNTASVIAIGASAGGVSAIRKILHWLDCRKQATPIVVIQHLPPSARLNVKLVYGFKGARPILEVEDKQQMKPGEVYMAAPSYHLLLERDGTLSLDQDEHVQFSRPSIDVFFESVARAFGSTAVGVILTGANKDGACGLRLLAEAGGFSVVQDPAEAETDIMPRAAIRERKPHRIWRLDEIGKFLNRLDVPQASTLRRRSSVHREVRP